MPKTTINFIKENHVADILGISKRSLGKFKTDLITSSLKKKKGHINYEILQDLSQFKSKENSNWLKESDIQ